MTQENTIADLAEGAGISFRRYRGRWLVAVGATIYRVSEGGRFEKVLDGARLEYQVSTWCGCG